MGEHEGYWYYTIGQRKGLGGGFSEPHYVVDLNSQDNIITIGNEEALLSKEFIVQKLLSGVSLVCVIVPDIVISLLLPLLSSPKADVSWNFKKKPLFP